MGGAFKWLPPLVLFSDYGGDWNKYVDALYGFFKADFIDKTPIFRGRRLGLKRYPLEQNKEATFWHMTSEGTVESERTPELRRCERIRWPKPTIECADESGVKVWASPKGNENRIHIWLETEDYVVVLADRGEYLLPWTAFYVDRSHQRRKLQKDYENYSKLGRQKS